MTHLLLRWLVRSFGVVLALIASPSIAQGVNDRILVHYIDVGQGAAALLEFPCGAVLIDAGGENAAAADGLVNYLEAVFARRPDFNRRLAAVFVTHTHIDHNIGLRKVAESFSIGGYVHNGIVSGSGRTNANWMSRWVEARGIPARAIDQRDVDRGGPWGLTDGLIDPLRCPGIDPRIRVLSGRYDANPGWPAGEFRSNGNLQSLVIRVDYGEASFLFTGDLEEHAIETLVHRLGPAGSLDVDVYAVGHHGSYNGTTQALLDAMTPYGAVISAGQPTVQRPFTAWAHGHPRRSLVALLDGAINWRRPEPRAVLVADAAKVFSSYNMTDTIYATSWDGTVFIQSAGDDRLFVQRTR